MGTIAKVKSVQGNGTWESPNGLFYKFDYEFDNGTTLNAMHKTQTPPFKAGDEVEYEVTKTTKYGSSGKVGKVQTGNFSKPTGIQPNTNFSNKSGMDTQKAIIYQNALSQANAFLGVKGYNPKMDALTELKDTADIIAKWVIAKASGESEERQDIKHESKPSNDLPF